MIKPGTEIKFVEDTKSRASVRTLPMTDEFAEYLQDIQQRQSKDKGKNGNISKSNSFLIKLWVLGPQKVERAALMAERLAHTKWMCKYHIVFTPKYRSKAIYNEI